MAKTLGFSWFFHVFPCFGAKALCFSQFFLVLGPKPCVFPSFSLFWVLLVPPRSTIVANTWRSTAIASCSRSTRSTKISCTRRPTPTPKCWLVVALALIKAVWDGFLDVFEGAEGWWFRIFWRFCLKLA